jgi:hypothetical protein
MRTAAVTCRFVRCQPPVAGDYPEVNASLIYLLLRQILQMLTQLARDGPAKEVELLVLRDQVAVLRPPASSSRPPPATRAAALIQDQSAQIRTARPTDATRTATSQTIAHEQARRQGCDRVAPSRQVPRYEVGTHRPTCRSRHEADGTGEIHSSQSEYP